MHSPVTLGNAVVRFGSGWFGPPKQSSKPAQARKEEENG
jgi:hypothetical protein